MKPLLLLVFTVLCIAGELPVNRLAQVDFKVKDLEKVRRFYGGILGLSEVAATGQNVVLFQINDDRFLLFALDTGMEPQSRMERLSLLSPDLKLLHAALLARGLKPGGIRKESHGRSCNPTLRRWSTIFTTRFRT